MYHVGLQFSDQVMSSPCCMLHTVRLIYGTGIAVASSCGMIFSNVLNFGRF